MKTQVQKDMYCKDHICLQRDAVAENGAAERAAADTNATTSNCCVECLHRVEQHNEHALDQQLLSVGSPRLPLCCMHGYLQGTCVLSSGVTLALCHPLGLDREEPACYLPASAREVEVSS